MSVPRPFALFFVTLVFWAVAGASQAQQSISPESLPCTQCHNETTMLVSKQAQLFHSLHGSGDAYVRGSNKNCSGCHGSEEASRRINESLMPHDASIVGVVNASPINCRTCHAIHTTYSLKDFGLTGNMAAVELERTGTFFDGGSGNLCAECHQFRNELPVAVDGQIAVETTRFGPHHGVEAQMLLGEGGVGLRSRPNVHYKEVGDTCVDCHMGTIAEKDPNDPLPALARNHTFEASVSYCTSCHEGIDSFDYQNVQTDIQALMDEVKQYLEQAGIMDTREGFENRSIEGTYPEEVAAAMWNYMMVLEDGSKGVHHPDWARQLLETARDDLANR